jgi:hypothetical protein
VQLSDDYWDDRAAFLWDTPKNAPAGVTQPKTHLDATKIALRVAGPAQ